MTAPTYVASGAAFKSTGSVTPTPPAGSVGDILILTVHGDENGSLTTPTGWNALSNSGINTGASATATGNTLWVFWRRATGTTSGSDGAGTFDTGTHTVARIHRYSGCVSTGSPILVEAGLVTTSPLTTPHVCPDITTTSPDTFVIIVAGQGVNNTIANYTTGTSTFDGDFTATPSKRGDDSTNTGSGTGGGCALWDGEVLAATTITGASLTMVASSAKTSIVFALAPDTVQPTSSDTGSSAESQSIATTRTDTGSGSEGTPTVAFNQTDTASGVDTGTIAASFNKTDTASGAETQSIAFNRTDTASGAEAQTISTSSSDTGSGTEGAPTVSFTQPDTGSGTETSSLTVTFTGTDTGLGTETQSVTVQISDSDTGSGAESHIIDATLSDSDTGTGVDTEDVFEGDPGSEFKNDADTGSGTETQNLTATLLGTDTSTGTESHSIQVTFNSSDIASGTESAFIGFTRTDTGSAVSETGSTSASVLQSDLAVWDDTWGDDETHINATLPPYGDTGHGTDVGIVDDSQGVPSGVTVTTLSDSSLLVTWNASGGADYYQIERDGVIVGQSAITSYTDTGLHALTTYTYRVRSVQTIA